MPPTPHLVWSTTPSPTIPSPRRVALALTSANTNLGTETPPSNHGPGTMSGTSPIVPSLIGKRRKFIDDNLDAGKSVEGQENNRIAQLNAVGGNVRAQDEDGKEGDQVLPGCGRVVCRNCCFENSQRSVTFPFVVLTMRSMILIVGVEFAPRIFLSFFLATRSLVATAMGAEPTPTHKFLTDLFCDQDAQIGQLIFHTQTPSTEPFGLIFFIVFNASSISLHYSTFCLVTPLSTLSPAHPNSSTGQRLIYWPCRTVLDLI